MEIELFRDQALFFRSIEADTAEDRLEMLNKHQQVGWLPDHPDIDRLSLVEFEKALYGQYKIIPKFNKYDFVKRKHGNNTKEIFQVTETGKDQVRVVTNQGLHITLVPENLIHATDEEKITGRLMKAFAEKDRSPWHLKKGDALISRHDPHSCDVKFVEGCDATGILLVNGHEDEFIPASEKERLTRDYIVFCFVEDRKDFWPGIK